MISDTDTIERIGVSKCNVKFEELGFIFREQKVADYGIDAIIETRNENYLSGKLIAVQIKSGDSYFKEKKNNKIVYRGENKHYDYWINHSLPVIIVLYSPTEDKFIWEIINKQTAKKLRKNWKVEIPYDQELENSSKILHEIAENQSEHERRWNSLVVAKDWMLKTLKYGESILEVQEWINKSSGRGTFILKVSDSEKENILCERNLFGFGIKKYEDVIQELFPWADIKIDDEFYEDNMQEDCYYKSQISDRESARMFGISGQELLKYSDDLPKIYPYKNAAGEVEFYRLKLTLNSVGKSFLEIEKFLEKGNFYLIDKLIKN